jgi:hypothetical protein
MRTFDYQREANRLLTQRSAYQVGLLQRFFGEKSVLELTAPDTLETMSSNALLQAVNEGYKSSGIPISFERVRELVHRMAEPQNEMEDSVFRYAQTLFLINDNGFSHENMLEDIIALSNHYLYGEVSSAQPQWRTHNKSQVRLLMQKNGGAGYSFTLPPPEEVPKLLAAICHEYSAIIKKGEINPLFIMAVFITDFAAIQPFDRGYYEINRLLVYYLMHWAGYDILGTIALSLLLKKGMYTTIAEKLNGWHEEKNSYQYFFDLWMEFSTEAYEVFGLWVASSAGRASTTTVVRNILAFYKERMTKKRIIEYAPHISESSIELALSSLKKQGLIKMTSRGRYAEYIIADPDT